MDHGTVRSGLRVTMTIALVCAFVASLFAWSTTAGASAGVQDTSLAVAAQTDTLTTEELVKEVNPAVVTVYNLTILEDGLGEEQAVTQGSGTGFVIDDEGHIVTNWHVVTGGTEFGVALYDGTTVEAELIGEDPRDDLAVVKIDPESVVKVVPLGDSDALEPGEPVVAIGSPLGAFTNTVTSGIVSALHRDDLGRLQGNCQNYSNLIQHDAAINPGNSGGPLFNVQGEVIGVNTLGLPISQDGTPLQGLFFAVPSNLVKVIAEQLIQDGRISAPYLGIGNVVIDPGLAAANDLENVDGAIYVQSVAPDSPAEEAGLREGDIILAVDDKPITMQEGLPNILLDYAPGDTVELTILRDGDEETVDLTFGNIPQEVLDACTLG
jgi:2-alkenal reductase